MKDFRNKAAEKGKVSESSKQKFVNGRRQNLKAEHSTIRHLPQSAKGRLKIAKPRRGSR
jgi:hypothetical protein